MEHVVSLVHLEWFQTRGISEKTLELTGIYSGRHLQNGADFIVEPDIEGKILVFPYFHHKEEVNAKYRAAGKKFYQKTGGTKTFFNVDVLDEPCLKDGSVSLVIVEGEMDALSVIEAGLPYVVSVPDGAPPPIVGPPEDDDIDFEHDTKYSYIRDNWEALKPIRKIIIAVDDDGPGRRLGEELVRRLHRVRCLFITYPEGCKDLNEVLVKHGKEAVIRTLVDAKPYAVSGLYQFNDLPPEPDFIPLSTGWGRLDAFLKPYFPSLMVVTGIPGAGKTAWVNQLVAQMSIRHGVGVAIASFEMRINPGVSTVLLNTYLEMKRDRGGPDWLQDNIVFIAPEPCDDNNNFDVEWLLERAKAAVIRFGIRILLVDPWNEIEHSFHRLENQSTYVGRALKAFKRFGKEFEVLVIVVAHPSKRGGEKDAADISLYDISDSAHFANKADFGVVLHRIKGSNETNVIITKVRDQQHAGEPGLVPFTFDTFTRTFSQ